MKRNDLIALLAVLAIFIVASAPRIYEFTQGGNRDNQPDGLGPVETPTRDMMSRVSPIRDAMDGQPNAVDLGWFFYHLGDVSKEVKTKRELVDLNHSIGDRMKDVGGNLSASAIVDDVERILLDSIGGRKHGLLTDRDHDQWRETCHAIAWACFKASGEKISLSGMSMARSLAVYYRTMPEAISIPHERDSFSLDRIKQLAHGCDLQPIGDGSLIARSPAIPAAEKKNGTPKITPVLLLGAGPQEDENTSERGPPQTSKPTNRRPEWLTHSLRFDQQAHESFLEKTPRFSTLYRGNPAIGQTRLLYRAARQFDPDIFDDDAQTTGDCVSHATANCCSTVNACQILVDGRPYEWTARAATEPIYGHRGHSGQGMTVERAADFINRIAGVPLRIDYGRHDFRRYDSRVGTNWGRSGVPADLIRELQKHPMRHAALVTSTSEARDAIANCFPLICGSSASFSFERDKHGFARRTRQGWAHAMAWLAVSTAQELAADDWRQYGRDPDSPCFLIANSWGPDWISGPRGKFDIPLGSFWVTESDAAYMIQQRQTIAVGDFHGFNSPPLETLGFEYLARSFRSTRGPPQLSGVVPIALAIAGLKSTKDPTRIESAPSPDPGPEPAPDPDDDVCPRCHGTGVIIMVDGNRGPCPCQHDQVTDPPRKKLLDYRSLFYTIDAADSGTFYLMVGGEYCRPCDVLKKQLIKRLEDGEQLTVGYLDAATSEGRSLLKGRTVPAILRIQKRDGRYERSWIASIPKRTS